MKVSPNLVNYQEYYDKLNKKIVDNINIPLIVFCGLTIIFYLLFLSGLGSSDSTSNAPYNVGVQPDTSGSSFSIFGFVMVLVLIFVIVTSLLSF